MGEYQHTGMHSHHGLLFYAESTEAHINRPNFRGYSGFSESHDNRRRVSHSNASVRSYSRTSVDEQSTNDVGRRTRLERLPKIYTYVMNAHTYAHIFSDRKVLAIRHGTLETIPRVCGDPSLERGTSKYFCLLFYIWNIEETPLHLLTCIYFLMSTK